MFFSKTSDSLIPSFIMSHVSKSLRSLTKNERCEQIDQVAHQKWEKWATMSNSRKLLTNNERIAQVAHQKWANERITPFFEWITHLLIFSQKKSNSLRKPMSEFPALPFTLKNKRKKVWNLSFKNYFFLPLKKSIFGF